MIGHVANELRHHKFREDRMRIHNTAPIITFFSVQINFLSTILEPAPINGSTNSFSSKIAASLFAMGTTHAWIRSDDFSVS